MLIDKGQLVADTTPDMIVDTKEFENAFNVKIKKISEVGSTAYKYELL